MSEPNETTGPTAMTTTAAPLPALHRSAGALGEALRTLPAWATFRQHLERLDATPPIPSAGVPERRVADLLDVVLTEGVPDPAELVAEVARSLVEEQAASIVSAAIVRHRALLAQELDGAATTGAPTVLSHLNTQLTTLLSEAQQVFAELGHVRTADEAIRSGLTEQWQQLPALQARYVDIRSAQTAMWRLTETRGRIMRDFVPAFIADPGAVDPDYTARRTQQRVETETGATRAPNAAPWPDLWSPEALAWLVAHPKARPWVPTGPELAAREDELEAEDLAYIGERNATRRACRR